MVLKARRYIHKADNRILVAHREFQSLSERACEQKKPKMIQAETVMAGQTGQEVKEEQRDAQHCGRELQEPNTSRPMDERGSSKHSRAVVLFPNAVPAHFSVLLLRNTQLSLMNGLEMSW
ncbi:hypothetical protein SRHO_G00139590 [Serrasalmus rhombeus]